MSEEDGIEVAESTRQKPDPEMLAMGAIKRHLINADMPAETKAVILSEAAGEPTENEVARNRVRSALNKLPADDRESVIEWATAKIRAEAAE